MRGEREGRHGRPAVHIKPLKNGYMPTIKKTLDPRAIKHGHHKPYSNTQGIGGKKLTAQARKEQ